eukprot:m.1511859 g.1511859  ORF g.1511859 m.1511859 type:complete len:1572 (+) comp25210_c0_seq4:232-4947(+)
MMSSSRTSTSDMGTDPMVSGPADGAPKMPGPGPIYAKKKTGGTRKGSRQLSISTPSTVDTLMEPNSSIVVASSSARGNQMNSSGCVVTATTTSSEMGTDPMEPTSTSLSLDDHIHQEGLDLFDAAAHTLGLAPYHEEIVSSTDGTLSSDDDDIEDEHDLIAEQLQQEMEAHITTFEALQVAESKLLEANRLHKVATQATVEQVRRAREATEARDVMANKYAQLQTTHVDDINALKRHFSSEVAQRDRTIEALRHAHAREIHALRTRVDELRGQVAALTWTERHAKEAQCLQPADLFGKLLLAESREACQGLVGELCRQLAPPTDHTDVAHAEQHDRALQWCTESGWITRLVQHVRRTRAAAETLHVCAALVTVPAFIDQILHSSLLEVIHNALFESSSTEAHTTTASGSGSATSDSGALKHAEVSHHAYVAVPEDARYDLMVMLHRCTRDAIEAVPTATVGRSHAAHAEAFVGAPGALPLLVHATLVECEQTLAWEQRPAQFSHGGADENTQARRRQLHDDTLRAAVDAFAAITSAMPHANVADQVLDAGGVAALCALLGYAVARDTGLGCLTALCTDVDRCQRIIAHGAVGAALHLLSLDLPLSAKSAKPNILSAKDGGDNATSAYAGNGFQHDTRGLCVQLLALLARVDTFASAFRALNGHEVLLQRVAMVTNTAWLSDTPGDRTCDVAREFAAEVFINMLSVAKGAALDMCTDVRVVRVMAIDGLSMTWQARGSSSAIVSRALDALYTVLSHDVALAASVPAAALDTIANVAVAAHASTQYKAMALLYHVFSGMQRQADGDDVLIRPSVIAAVHHVATSAHGRQLRMWTSTLALGVTRGMLRQWTLPTVNTLSDTLCTQLFAAICALLPAAPSERSRSSPAKNNDEPKVLGQHFAAAGSENCADDMEQISAGHAALAAVSWAVYADVVGLTETNDVARVLENSVEGNLVDGVVQGLRFADVDETIQAFKVLAHRSTLRPIFASLCPHLLWLMVHGSPTTGGGPGDAIVRTIGDACELALAPNEESPMENPLMDARFAQCVRFDAAFAGVVTKVLTMQPTHPLGVRVLDTLLTSLSAATSSEPARVQGSWFMEAMVLGSTRSHSPHDAGTPESPQSEPSFLRALGAMMYADSTVFLMGADILAKLLTTHVAMEGADPDAERFVAAAVVVREVGLSLLLDVVGSTGGNHTLQRSVAVALPKLLRACTPTELEHALGHTHALTHLAGLIETTSDPVAMATALAVVSLLVDTPSHALALVQGGALRALAEVSVMQQYAQRPRDAGRGTRDRLGGMSLEEQARQTRACLERLLAYGTFLTPCLSDSGGVGVLLQLLRDSESECVVTRGLEILADVANRECAGDVLDLDGVRTIAQWCAPSTDGATNTDAIETMHRTWAHRIVVNLCWCIRRGSAHDSRTTYQHLARVIADGGLPALLAAVHGIPPASAENVNPINNRTVEEEAAATNDQGGVVVTTTSVDVELQRRALWAIASWLSVDSPDNKVLFIRAGGLAALLSITDGIAPPDLCRFARLALGKLLQVHGEDLTIRIEILRSHVTNGTIQEYWEAEGQQI